METLMSPQQVADALGVTVQTLAVWRCTHRYDLSWVKVGRNVMYRPEHVREFIEKQTHVVVDGSRKKLG
jgi:hypothetical protein